MSSPEFKIGDRVRHKLSDIFMTIKKIDGYVAVCKRDEPVYSKFDPYTPIFTAICSIENLEHEEEER